MREHFGHPIGSTLEVCCRCSSSRMRRTGCPSGHRSTAGCGSWCAGQRRTARRTRTKRGFWTVSETGVKRSHRASFARLVIQIAHKPVVPQSTSTLPPRKPSSVIEAATGRPRQQLPDTQLSVMARLTAQSAEQLDLRQWALCQDGCPQWAA